MNEYIPVHKVRTGTPPYPEDDPAVVETVDQKSHVEMDKEESIDSKPYQLKRKQQVTARLKLWVLR